jgi:hypothetical protein
MVIKIPTFSIPRPSKKYSYWGFWFENKPSGNPGMKNNYIGKGETFF